MASVEELVKQYETDEALQKEVASAPAGAGRKCIPISGV